MCPSRWGVGVRSWLVSIHMGSDHSWYLSRWGQITVCVHPGGVRSWLVSIHMGSDHSWYLSRWDQITVCIHPGGVRSWLVSIHMGSDHSWYLSRWGHIIVGDHPYGVRSWLVSIQVRSDHSRCPSRWCQITVIVTKQVRFSFQVHCYHHLFLILNSNIGISRLFWNRLGLLVLLQSLCCHGYRNMNALSWL